MQKILWMLGLVMFLGNAQAQSRTIDIPAQDLSDALHTLSNQTGIQLLFTAENLKGIRSQAINGSMDADQALARLLQGTPYIHLASGKDTYVIKESGEKAAAPKSTMLPEIMVRSANEPGSPFNNQFIRAHTTTATKTNTPIMETPFSVQVLPRQILQDQQAIRLDSVLQNVSGVTHMPTNQGGSDGFVIRGFNSDTTYRNGVFMPNSLGGGTVKREMANIEEIQVLKGPGSILFGRADPGGIINTVTKQPLATPYYSLQQQAGSFDFYRTTVDATGPLTKDDRLLYRLNLSYENSGSFRDFVNNRSVFIAPVVKLNISPQTQVTAELEYQSFKNVADPGIPNVGNRPADVPRNLFAGEPINNRNNGDRFFVGVNWSHMINNDWTISHRLSAELMDYNSNSLFWFTPATANGSLERFFNNAPINHSNRYQTSVNLTGHVTTGILKHTLLFGYDYIFLDDKIKGNNCCVSAPAFNIFNPIYLAGRPILDSSNNSNMGFTQSWHGSYFQDQVKLPYNFHAMGGFRYDNAVGRNTVTDLTTSAEDRFTPRGGLLWQPMPWLSLYGSYTENFGASNTLFNTDGQRLPPQTAQQWEAGLKTEFLDGRLRSTFSYFELTKQGIGAPDPTNPFRSRAIGEAETRGFEFDVAGEVLPGWNLIATYSHLPFAKITKDRGTEFDLDGNPIGTNLGNQGKRLFLAAEHTGTLWSTYEFQNEMLRGLKLGGGIQGIGKRQGNPGNTYRLPEFVIGNLMASYQVKILHKMRLTAQLNVLNVSDEKYFVGTNSGSFITIGAPRTFMGSLRIDY